MSKRYQILVEAVIAQNEEQKISFEKSLNANIFKDLTLKISKVKLDEGAVASLQKQIQDALASAGLNLKKLDKLTSNVANATKQGLIKGGEEGSSQLFEQVEKALFKAGSAFDPLKGLVNEGYGISKVTKVFDEKDVSVLKGYNVELQKVSGNIRTVSTNFVAADKESNELFGEMASQGMTANEILGKITVSAQEAGAKFAALKGLISQGFKVTGVTEQFGMDEKGNARLVSYSANIEKIEGNLKKVATAYVTVDETGNEFLNRISSAGKEIASASIQIEKYIENLKQLKNHHAEAFKNKNVQNYAQELESTFIAFGKGTKTIDDVALASQKLNGEIETVEKGFHTVTTATENFIGSMKIALNKILLWGVGTSIIYGTLRQFKEAIQYVKDLNKELTNIQVVTGQSVDQVKNLAQEYNRLASMMGASTLEITKAALTFIRQGKTAEEATILLKDSLMISKLAAIESAEASDYLTSMMNGYKFSVEEVEGAVDKMVAVDNAAATSVAELAEALSRTSSVAEISGVKFENLVAYVGTISSITRRSAESIGEALKTVFTRMENIKLGNLDEAGESINDVEKALSRVDIKLRINETTFRDMDDVLADVAEKWDTFDDVTRASITNALAGTRQANIMIALLDNWEMAQQLLTEEMNSAGLAAQRYQIYMDNAEAATNKFTAAWEKLASDTINSDFIISFTNFGTLLLKVIDDIGLLTIALVALATKGFVTGIVSQYTIAIQYLSKILLGATVSATALNVAIGTIAFAVAISAIWGLTKAFERTNKAIIIFKDNYVKLGDEFESNLTELDGLINRYRQLCNQTELSLQDQSELLDIVSVLNTKYGLAAEGVDLYTTALKGSNEEQANAIELAEKSKKIMAEEFLDKNRSAIEYAEKWMKTPQIYDQREGSFWGKPQEILEQLQELASKEKNINGVWHKRYELMLNNIAAYQDIIDKAKYYQEILNDILGFSVSNNTGLPEGLFEVGETEKEISATQKFAITMEEAGKAIQNALNIYKEFMEAKELSTDQILNIIANNENWMELLTTENGKIILNTYALRNNTLEKIDNAISTLKLQLVEGQLNIELLKQIGILEQLKIQVIDDFNEISNARAKAEAEAAKAQADELNAKAVEIREQAYQDLLRMTIDMLRQKKQAEIDALQAQLDSYKAIIDAEKELIEQKEKERDYDKEKAERNERIADIEAELAEAQFDTSEEGIARKLELEEKLKEEKEGLDELEHDRSVELQEDALDKEYKKFEKDIEKRIKVLEDYLKESGTITQDAIALLSSRSGEFYQSLIEWNRQFGTGIDEDVVGAWQRAFNALVAYAQAAEQLGVGTGGGGITPIGDQGDLTGKTVELDNPYGTEVQVFASSNSTEPVETIQEGRKYVIKEYKSGAKAPYKINIADFGDDPTYVWVKSRNVLFEQYHTGLEKGVVGGKSDKYGEVFANLLKGEYVINPQQIKDYVTTIFPKSVNAIVKGNNGGEIKMGDFMPMIIQGNLDSSVLPEVKKMINEGLKEFDHTLKKRGIFRSAKNYSL